MIEQQRSLGNSLQEENTFLRSRVAELEEAEKQRQSNFSALAEKEAFNFALFQYNPILTVVVDRNGRVIKSNRAKRHSGDRIPAIGDVMYRDYASRHQIDMYEEMIGCINRVDTKSFPELKYEEKTISVTISGFPQGAIITSQDITERKTIERDRLNLISDLRRALDEVETLRGLLPICSCCKKIRDDKGYWNHIEVYISKHSFADFTHTLCPGCVKEHYPEYWEQMQDRKAAVAAENQSVG